MNALSHPTNKNSLEDPGTSDMEEPRDEPSTLQDSYNDISVDHLLNNFQLVGTDTHQASNGMNEFNTVELSGCFGALTPFHAHLLPCLVFAATLRRGPHSYESSKSSS